MTLLKPNNQEESAAASSKERPISLIEKFSRPTCHMKLNVEILSAIVKCTKERPGRDNIRLAYSGLPAVTSI
jgi:hypothetical protein